MSQDIYFFPWQNPVLRSSIYPYRENKLRDFLLIFQEVDLWSNLRNRDIGDPVVRKRLEELEMKSRTEREKVTKALQAGITARIQGDSWFARITGRDEKNLRFKRLYYLNRMITENTRRLADLESRKLSLLRRVDWYPEGDSRRQTWEGRAKELDAPLDAVKQELDNLTLLQALFDKEARLPQQEKGKLPTIADLARAELAEYQRELEHLNHDQLIEKVWQRLNERLGSGKPRVEKWFAYMIIHFSGMRYMSAHGSWADPNDLLELLVREDQKGKIKPGEDIDDKVEAEIQRLLNLPANEATRHLDANQRALIFYKQLKDRQGEPIPDWVWDEIVKYSQLRLGVNEEDWEEISPERWKFENRRWREIMANWQHADITSWRNAHRQTLDLIVTRAVCNEIAEHIQHLRGNVPSGGLTSKPNWYLRLQRQTQGLLENDPQKCFFHHANTSRDFINGASVFWLGWVDREPNAWQVARDLQGIDLWPGIKLAGSQPVGKAGKTKPPPQDGGWSYSKSGAAYIRTRKINVQIPSVRELRKRGMTDREIDAFRAEMRKQNTLDKEYLRWKHEAIAVDVVDLIDGPHVLTFETGNIGINWHQINSLVNNPYDQVFVGYLPKAEKEPENLPKMLDAQKILHKTAPLPTVIEIPTGGVPIAREFGAVPAEDTFVTESEPVIPLMAGAFPVSSIMDLDEQTINLLPKFYVYFITNKGRKVLFTGITSDIKVRVADHIAGLIPSILKRTVLNRLVFYQAYESLEDAIAVAQLFETFHEEEKMEFITANNPDWRDLADEL